MPGIELDAIDRRILKAMQVNARMRNVDLAEAVGCRPRRVSGGSSDWRTRA